MKIKKLILLSLSAIFIVFALIAYQIDNEYKANAIKFEVFVENIREGITSDKVHSIAKRTGFEYVAVVYQDKEEALGYKQYIALLENEPDNITEERYFFTGVLYNYDFTVIYNEAGTVIEAGGDM